jgi:fructose-1,6-bisphosphatase/inositol monophosphatase family enzyme
MNDLIAERGLDAELAFAVETAKRIGRLAHDAGPVTANTKHDGTPQTRLDVAGNELFHQAVHDTWSGRGDDALSEEDLEQDRTFPPGVRVWICDPFDGTWLLPFGLPYTVVSIALVRDGQPLVAVVHDPHSNRTFTAIRGQGTHLNGAPVTVNDADSFTDQVLMLPGGNTAGLDIAAMHANAISAGADVMTVGSVINDATNVVLGFAAGMVYPYYSPWDMAAVALLVTEAGGQITGLDGIIQRYDGALRGAIVSNGRVHGALVDLVAAGYPF